MSEKLKAPFPYFGGKSAVASLIWRRLGDVENYCEPFYGSGAVLLARPQPFKGAEAVSDVDSMIANFWRAVQADPDAVAKWADGPVNEADMHSRHRWLVLGDDAAAFRERMRTDPHHHDAKVAGWWAWGLSCWIGSGWCADKGVSRGANQMPVNNGSRCGVAALPQQRPHIGDPAGSGVHRVATAGLSPGKRPQIGVGGPNGVHTNASLGTCQKRRAWLTDWMRRLQDRLRMVRVCCGHWNRICDSPSTTTRLGLTGVFLDPPYPIRQAGKKSRDGALYGSDAGTCAESLRDEVLAWCVRYGENRQMRIVVAGYEGDGYEALVKDHGWREEAWKNQGGYANQGASNDNAARERLWSSPACVFERGLFDEEAA